MWKDKCSQGRASVISLPLSKASPVLSKPDYSASLFSMPLLDFRQVGSCSKALLCIFCQKSNKPKDDVREATSYTKNVVYEATTKRRKHRDVANREV